MESEAKRRVRGDPPKSRFIVLGNIIDIAWLDDQVDPDGLFRTSYSQGRSMGV